MAIIILLPSISFVVVVTSPECLQQMLSQPNEKCIQISPTEMVLSQKTEIAKNQKREKLKTRKTENAKNQKREKPKTRKTKN